MVRRNVITFAGMKFNIIRSVRAKFMNKWYYLFDYPRLSNKTIIMANTYSQISMHIVFAVKYRESLILPGFRNELFRYINGIIEGKKQKSLAVNGVFSCGYSQRDYVIKYIMNQEQHHRRKSFQKEYLAMLKRMEVQYGVQEHSLHRSDIMAGMKFLSRETITYFCRIF